MRHCFSCRKHIREQNSENSVPCPLGLYVLAKTESEIGTQESRWMKLKEEDATVAESHPLSCRHTRYKGGVSLEAAHLSEVRPRGPVSCVALNRLEKQSLTIEFGSGVSKNAGGGCRGGCWRDITGQRGE